MLIADHKSDRLIGEIPEDDFWDDEHDENLNGKELISCIVSKDNSDAQYLSKRNRVIIKVDNNELREFIVELSELEREGKFISATASYLELEKARPILAQSFPALPVKSHVDFVLTGTGYQAGRIEYSGLRSLEFEDHINPYKALKKIASLFDLELYFTIEYSGNMITGRYVNMVKRRGIWDGREFESGVDLIDAVKKENVGKIATALLVIGPEDDNGERMTVEVTNEEARQEWGRKGDHIWDIYEVDSDNDEMTIEELTQHGEEELNKRISSAIEFEIKGADLEHILGYEHLKVRLGDEARVKVTEYDPPIYLDSRIIRRRGPFKRKTEKTYTLGEFIEYSVLDARKLRDELLKKIANSQTSVAFGENPPGDTRKLWFKTRTDKPDILYYYNRDTDTWEKADVTDFNELIGQAVGNQIENGAISNEKLDRLSVNRIIIDSADIAEAAIERALIADLAVGFAQIGDLSVGNAKIQDAAITTAKIQDASIKSAKIDSAAITSAHIADASITSADIGLAEIVTANIRDASITNAKIDRASVDKLVVTTADIADAAITTALIQDASIIGAKIADATINTAKIADASITNAKIDNGAITSAKIGDAQIGTAKIAIGAITTALLGDAVVDTAQLANASVTDAKIVNLTANKLTAGSIDTDIISIQSANGQLVITSDRLQIFDNQDPAIERVSIGNVNDDGTVYGLKVRGSDGTTVLYDQDGVYTAGITDGAITNPKIGNYAVDNRVITANTITGDKLIVDSITAREIASKTITSNEIVTGTITAASGIIADAAITTAKIADASITNAKIASIDAQKITTGVLDAERVTIGSSTNFASGYDPTTKATPEYIRSRGENLVTNGTGYLQDNTNFSSTIFDGSTTPYGNGSFRYETAGSGQFFTDEIIPIDPKKAYRFNASIKGSDENGRFYFAVEPNDRDGLAIGPRNVRYIPGSTTTLAQEINDGDTVVYFTDVSGFIDTSTTHEQMLIFWNYISSDGFEYPVETYSRNISDSSLWAQGNIDYTNNAIILSSPWNRGVVAAGTDVSQGGSGGGYIYPIVNKSYTLDFTEYEGVIDAYLETAPGGLDGFPPYTAGVRVGFLANRDVAEGMTSWYSNISFMNIQAEVNAELYTNESVSPINDQIEVWQFGDTTYINGGNIYTGTVTANQIKAGTITAASGILADAVITTAKIADASITNAKIANISAEKITTGTLDAARVTIGSGTSFASGYDPTTKATPTDVQNAEDASILYTDTHTGNLVNNTTLSGTNDRWTASLGSQDFFGETVPVLLSETSGNAQEYSDVFDVDPSKAYQVSGWFKKSEIQGRIYLGLNVFDINGTEITLDQINTDGSLAYSDANVYLYFSNSDDSPTDWVHIVAYVMPVGTKLENMANIGSFPVGNNYNARFKPDTAQMEIRFLNYSNTTTTQVWVANPKVVEVDPLSVIRSSSAFDSVEGWKYSDTTYIDGGNIYTGTITANEIAANAVTADKIDVSELSSITADIGYLQGGTIYGTTILGGTISSDSTISVSTDLYVGNNAYIGNQAAEVTKMIHLANGAVISGHPTAYGSFPYINFSSSGIDVSDGDLIVRHVVDRTNLNTILEDHGNGNITLSASSGDLYLGYVNTSKVRMSAQVVHEDYKFENGYNMWGVRAPYVNDDTYLTIAVYSSVTMNNSTSGYTDVYYPITFDDSTIYAVCQPTDGGSFSYTAGVYNMTPSSCRVYLNNISGYAATATINITVVACGRLSSQH